MKLNCEAGKMALVVKAALTENQGKTVTTIRIATEADTKSWGYSFPYDPLWVTDRQMKNMDGKYVPYAFDWQLRKLSSDQPGNEQFVTESRKSLPRSKPATTKGDTITERGELA